MNKEKALLSIEDKIEWAKASISKAQMYQINSDIRYLTGVLEAYEGIKTRIEDGEWD